MTFFFDHERGYAHGSCGMPGPSRARMNCRRLARWEREDVGERVAGVWKSWEAERRSESIILSWGADVDSVKFRNRSSARPSICATLFVRGVVLIGKSISGRVEMNRSDWTKIMS